MKTAIVFLLIIFFSPTQIFSQKNILGTSHFVRGIRLGNTYTGIAEGAEALYYNPAGIATNKYYSFIFSSGQGYALFVDNPVAYDYGLVIPVSNDIGSFGFSLYTLNYNYSSLFISEVDNSDKLYSISYARNITDNLSLGISGNFYSFKFDPEFYSYSGSGFFIGLSGLFSISDNLIMPEDKFQIGVSLSNILNNKLTNNDTIKIHMHQNIRYGFSYLFNTFINNIKFIKFLFAFDLIANGLDNNYIYLNPNFGIQLTIVDVFHLSYGRENQDIIKPFNSPFQQPVNRFGLGLDIPLNETLNIGHEAWLRLDYCFSNWEKIDEDKASIGGEKAVRINQNTFSASMNVEF